MKQASNSIDRDVDQPKSKNKKKINNLLLLYGFNHFILDCIVD